ncbi:MAG: hypothetical protein ACFFCT_14285 [Candidatus Odinarchaeota archaeon]
MNQTRKKLVVALLLFMIVPFSIIIWSLDPASSSVVIPSDVRVKLDRNLEEAIGSFSWNHPHNCMVYIRLTGNISEDMQIVLDTLPSHLILEISESQALFQAILNAQQIFDIARMDEVRKIELTTHVTILD